MGAMGTSGMRTVGGRGRGWTRSARPPAVSAAAAAALCLLAALAARPADALVISPLPGTPDASPATQISFLDVPPSQLRDISVVGSRSGRHDGRTADYLSAAGESFIPARPFAPGEAVRVSATVGPPAHRRRIGDTFTVARPAYYAIRPIAAAGAARTAPPGEVQQFASEPGLEPPAMQVIADSPQATPGDVFLTPAHGVGQFGPMIVDGAGNLVWFQRAPPGELAEDLQVQQYEGRPVLVWWQGTITQLGVGFGSDEIYASDYRPIAQLSGGNGYRADLHDIQLTPRGSAFITAYALVHADLSSLGGSKDGELADAVVQEIDVRTGLVMFEWHALGHVELGDSYTKPGAADEPWDYFHVNSISLDPWGDGNVLVSSRNTWAAYEISKHTGEVMWRIGGRHPTFRMGAGTGTAWQHDVRWQPDHTITVFDDGSAPPEHTQSRVIRERIEWHDRTVELVGRYVHTPPVLAGSQGNDEVLADGDSFVGWGEAPLLTEFGPAGQILFDARLPPAGQSYRAYRFPWRGRPASAPSIAVRAGAGGAATVYASWNGATEVRSWRILGGGGPTTMTPLESVPRAGFQTSATIAGGARWFAVQALDSSGGLLGTSRAVELSALGG